MNSTNRMAVISVPSGKNLMIGQKFNSNNNKNNNDDDDDDDDGDDFNNSTSTKWLFTRYLQ